MAHRMAKKTINIKPNLKLRSNETPHPKLAPNWRPGCIRTQELKHSVVAIRRQPSNRSSHSGGVVKSKKRACLRKGGVVKVKRGRV